MNKATKRDILFNSFVKPLEADYGSMSEVDESDVRYKNMRNFVDHSFETDPETEKFTPKRKRKHMWTDYEVSYLKKHYKDTSTKKIATVLGIELVRVNSKARKLGLTKSRADTKKRMQFVKENHMKMTKTEMAKSLGVTFAGIDYYMDKAGLKSGIDGRFKKG